MMPIEHLELWIAQYGYAAILGLLALGIVGLPVPDETLLTLTGFLVYKGVLHPVSAYLSSLTGTAIGISVSYFIGRVGGVRFARRFGQRLHIRPEALERVEGWFHRRGRWALVGGYFVPGVRHIFAIVAGSSGLDFGSFARFAFVGAALWSGFFIGGGFYLGEEWSALPQLARPIALVVAVVVVVASAGYVVYRRRLKKHRS